jgi:hypothetical protein
MAWEEASIDGTAAGLKQSDAYTMKSPLMLIDAG